MRAKAPHSFRSDNTRVTTYSGWGRGRTFNIPRQPGSAQSRWMFDVVPDVRSEASVFGSGQVAPGYPQALTGGLQGGGWAGERSNAS